MTPNCDDCDRPFNIAAFPQIVRREQGRLPPICLQCSVERVSCAIAARRYGTLTASRSAPAVDRPAIQHDIDLFGDG